MKQLILFLFLLGCSVTAYAQTDTIVMKTQSLSEIREISDTVGFVAPDHLDFFDSSQAPIRYLRDLLLHKSKKELNFVQNISRSVPASKFQLIVDKGGNIIDCSLVESTDASKDNTVMNFLPNSRLFISPGKINGEPCNSVVVLSICYQNIGVTIGMDSYPILPI